MEKLSEVAYKEYRNYITSNKPEYFHNLDNHLSYDETYKCIDVMSFEEIKLEREFKETLNIVNHIFYNTKVFKVFFAIMEGPKFIAPHKNKENNLFYRLQLGIKVDERDDGTLTVRKQQFKWRQNQVVIFDTTKTHCVYKSENYERILLVIDFDRTNIPSELESCFKMI